MEYQSEAYALFEMLPVSSILWGFLGLLFIMFGVYSVILLWHWKQYSTGKFTTVANMVVYLSVSAGLFVVMTLATIWFSFSS